MWWSEKGYCSKDPILLWQAYKQLRSRLEGAVSRNMDGGGEERCAAKDNSFC